MPDTTDMLSEAERQKAIDLISAEAELWYRLARMRHTTEAERELFARNGQILSRVQDIISIRSPR